VTSFAEPSPTPNDKDPETGGIQRNFWFALNEDRPLFFFAGLWTRWYGVRKVKEGPGDHEVYGMTTKPNALIAPIHEKAMPVILTTQGETETWLTAPWSEAKRLQRTAPDDALVIVEKPATQVKVPQQAPTQGSLF
jgi:putative SOS response-associated peptidase YedK